MEKKKFLFVSYTALITDIAWVIQREGHDVKYCIKEEADKEIGDGFVPKVDDWEAEVDWADVIVFDDVLGMGKMAEDLRKKGKKVIGGTEYTDKLEDDRNFGQEELKKAGVSIIPYKNFTSFEDAIAYIKTNPGKYVFKPSGNAANKKRLLFVGEEEDGRDTIKVLEAYMKAWKGLIKEFQLQKKVTGVEIAVGAFFNGKQFINPINVNFEHKKLFPGNIGPSTGEMGTSMYWSNPNRIFNSTLKKMEGKLAEEGYVGYIDINTIVNNNGIYPLEFTSRFGYPCISIQQEGMITPISELFYQLACGEVPKLKVKKGFQIGVRIIVPPYPFDDKVAFDSESKDSVVLFKKPITINGGSNGIHIEDLKQVDEQWLITGESGVAMIVCGCGATMKQAQAQAYTRIKNITIPNMYYRKDIGDRWFDDSDRLHNWGYLRDY